MFKFPVADEVEAGPSESQDLAIAQLHVLSDRQLAVLFAGN